MIKDSDKLATLENIPLCVPYLHGNESIYVQECLDTNWVSSSGSFVNRFEQLMAEFLGVKYAVATVNGTSALHIALLISGIGPEHEVLVPSLTFIAPANAVRYVGAWPVFLDVDPDYWQMDPMKVEHFLENECYWSGDSLVNVVTGRQVKGILPVHILGHPCDMEPILDLGRKFGLAVIEDATESLGAQYQGKMVGSLGELGCLSFNGNKLITTGSGGMLVTNDQSLAERARYLTTQAKDDSVEYIHNTIGYNYRLSNLNAAMGCAQLEMIESFIEKKRQIAAFYCKALEGIPGLHLMQEADWAKSVFWMFTARIDQQTFGMSSRALLKELAKIGIETRPLWEPMHKSRAHLESFFMSDGISDDLYQECLSIPCSVGLDLPEQQRVIDAFKMLCPK